MIVDRSLAVSQGEWAMSFVIAAPDLVQGAAQNLAGIRASLAEAAASAAGPTTGVVPAAADEVSAAISALFGNFGQQFQTLSAQAQAFHANFVGLMKAGAGAYVNTEFANAGLLGGLAAATSGGGGLLGGLAAATTGGGGLLGGLTGGGLLGGLTGGGLLGGLTGGGLLGGLTGGGLLGGLTGGGLLGGLGLTGPTPLGLLLGGLLGSSGLGLIHTGPFDGFFSPLVRELRALEQAFLNELHSVEQAVVHAIGGGASFAAAAAATPGAGDLLGGLLGGGSGSGGLVGGLIGGTSGGGGLLGGLAAATTGGGGLLGGLTGTSGLGGFGAQDVAAMAGYPSGASAAAAQLAPWQQSLYNTSSKLAALLGLSPVTHPVAGDPDFGSQVTSFGFATQTALADPDDNFFDAIIFSSPQFTDTLTSGFEPTLGLGAPGHTINTVQSPVLPFLNSSISIPVTDPIAPLFAALLPLGF
jgi:hypothetical protein